MTVDEIRAAYLSYFQEKGHLIVPSSSLVPVGDPTLLFTSAGMVQFKPYFMGEAPPPFDKAQGRPNRRLTSCQKCFRTTDIDSVGDASHLTFFEMLGNFSVGDYFKQGAIEFAWEFMTERLGLPRERLWITIFQDDDEAFAIWRGMGVPTERIVRCGEKDNFWGPAGETGPCGPCTEIHYDYGPRPGHESCDPSHGCERFLEVWNLVFMQYYQDAQGQRTPLPMKNVDTGMGLERIAAVLQGKTNVYETDIFTPLIAKAEELTGHRYGPSTGPSARLRTGSGHRESAEVDRALRVMAEHGRAVTFLVADGVLPSNEGRGYVLRRVLRRAVRFARRLGLGEPFLAQMAQEVIAQMGGVYPTLRERQDFILRLLEQEETRFEQTLAQGLELLEAGLLPFRKGLVAITGTWVNRITSALMQPRPENLAAEVEEANAEARDGLMGLVTVGGTRQPGQRVRFPTDAWPMGVPWMDALARLQPTEDAFGEESQRILDIAIQYLPRAPKSGQATVLKSDRETVEVALQRVDSLGRMLTGAEAFRLYDTYGFPIELTREIAAEHGLAVDEPGFRQEMEAQRERARAAHRFYLGERGSQVYQELAKSPTRFLGYETTQAISTIVGLIVDGEGVERIEASTGGGEVVLAETPFYGESGGQMGDTGEIRGPNGRFIVEDTVRPVGDLIIHRGRMVEGSLSLDEAVEAVVDRERRLDIARNHTATHLLHAALRQVLGPQVRQSGSLVAPDRLRFDFSHLSPLSPDELREVQRRANAAIRLDLPVHTTFTTFNEAVARGAMALFDEKYGEQVRLVQVGPEASPFSLELCGGTHLRATGEIGHLIITGESSIGAGLRRIEAVTGRGAEALVEERLGALDEVAQTLGSPLGKVAAKAVALVEEKEEWQRRAAQLERELGQRVVEAQLARAEAVDGVRVLTAQVPVTSMETLRQVGDYARAKLGSGVVVLGAIYDDRPHFLAMVTSDLVAQGFHAGEIVKKVAAVAGGSGGGRPELGQAGGRDKAKLDEALHLVRRLIRDRRPEP